MIRSIYVETSSRCNLACVYCYHTGQRYASRDKLLPVDMLAKLLTDALASREALFGAQKPDIFLHAYGEPTLHPQLADCVRLAADSGLFGAIRFVSNLQAVEPAAYEAYFEAGLTGLYVSLDTLRPEDLEQTRRGTNLEKLLAGLDVLARKHADALCVISVLSPTNKDMLPAVGAFLDERRIPVWNIQLLNTRQGRFGLDADAVADIKAALLTRFPGMRINFEEASLLHCRQPFNTLVVNAAGYLTPCCSLTNHEVVHFGNIAEADLATLWNGPAYAAFRETFARKAPPACAGCPYYDTPTVSDSPADQGE